MRIIVYVLLALAAITTLVSLFGPNIDLLLAQAFFDPATHRFFGYGSPRLAFLREEGAVSIYTCVGVIILGLASFLPWRLPSMAPRKALALTLSLLLGPGLLVNGVLKPYWGRPRPIEVTQFGGELKFVDWWNPTGASTGNGSFMSGEGSTAAWMVGPAMFVPPPWRAWAIGAAMIFAVGISVLRMTAGAHFLSDVVLGMLSTILILLAMNWVCRVRTDSGP